MSEIKFGWNQKGNPTPTHIATRLNVAAKCCMGLVVAVNSAPFLTASTASTISWFLAAIAPLLMEMKRLWGIETDEEMVPTENVDTMEETKTEEKTK